MTDNMIVKPVSRRRFFMFLGAAAASPIIHHIIPNKLIFDMSGSVKVATLDEINQITMRFIIPALADKVFKPSPIFWSGQVNPTRWDAKVVRVVS